MAQQATYISTLSMAEASGDDGANRSRYRWVDYVTNEEKIGMHYCALQKLYYLCHAKR